MESGAFRNGKRIFACATSLRGWGKIVDFVYYSYLVRHNIRMGWEGFPKNAEPLRFSSRSAKRHIQSSKTKEYCLFYCLLVSVCHAELTAVGTK